MPVLKVWSMDQTEKRTVLLTEMSIAQMLEKANAKGIIGNKVFLLDGTEVDEDDAIIEYKDNPFLIGNEYTNNKIRSNNTDSASTVSHLDTLSLSSPSVKSNSSFDSNTAFIVPHDKVPNSLLAKLNDDESPVRTSDINALVRIVAEELIYAVPRPNRSHYKVIAQELCERYPVLNDRDEDTKELIGSGFSTIFKKIEERIHYLQRPNNLPGNTGTTKKKIKAVKNLSAGCKDWEPPIPKEETPESQRQKQQWLAKKSTIKERDEDKVEHFMEVTYSYTRQFLNASPTLKEVLAEWPILMEPKYLIKHFERLCCINTSDCISTYLGKITKSTEKLKVICKNSESTTVENSDIICTFLNLVGQYFKEDSALLIQNCQEQEVSKNDVINLAKTPSPSIISVGDTDKIYYLIIEKTIISEVRSSSEALKIVIAAYYVLNLAYPIEGQCTLEFLQRYIFKINPAEGSKVKKTTKQLRGKILSKVLSLITKLRKE